MSMSAIYPAAGALAAMAVPTGKAAGAAADSFASYLDAAANQTFAAVQNLGGSPTLEDQEKLAASLAAAGDAVQVNDIRQSAETRLESLGREITSRLAALGIELTEPLAVQVAADGRLVVGEHPQRDAIEKMLNEDPKLANQLRELSAQFSLLHAADQHLEFLDAYEQDPVAAVKQFAHLFRDKNASGVQLLFDEFVSTAEPLCIRN